MIFCQVITTWLPVHVVVIGTVHSHTILEVILFAFTFNLVKVNKTNI